jgi:cysteine desulfuration protein SufE
VRILGGCTYRFLSLVFLHYFYFYFHFHFHLIAVMTIQEAQDAIVQDFDDLPDWEERYAHIIALGRAMQPFPNDWRTGDNIVRGCQSQIWIQSSLENGTVRFQGDSDAAIVKGLIALVLAVYSGRTPHEITQTEPEFIKRIGLDGQLSSTRTSGLASMIKKIKMYALGYMMILEQENRITNDNADNNTNNTNHHALS